MKFIEETVKQYVAKLEALSEKIKSLPCLMLIGNTGNGKSSLKGVLSGSCNVVKNKGRLVFDGEGVGSGLKSMTVGADFKEVCGVLMGDLAGLQDNRGVHIEIVNMLLINKAFNFCGKVSTVSCLLVVNAAHFERSSFNNFKNSINVINEMFGSFSNVKDALGLVISFADDNETAEYYLGPLEDSG